MVETGSLYLTWARDGRTDRQTDRITIAKIRAKHDVLSSVKTELKLQTGGNKL